MRWQSRIKVRRTQLVVAMLQGTDRYRGRPRSPIRRTVTDSDTVGRRIGIFYLGVRPAISVGISVSRVGSAAQIKAMKQVAGRIKLDLAQFRELAAFAQFGSDLDPKTQAQLELGKRIVELFKQIQYQPIPVEVQVAVLWAVQNKLMDDVAVDKIKDFQLKLTDFLQTRKAEVLGRLAKEKAISDELTGLLKAAITEFKQTYR